jgi:hypothetical protein
MMAERPSSAGKSLDVKLVTEEPDLVMAHLKARHASEEQMSSVADIGGKVHFRVLGCAVFALSTTGDSPLSLLSNLPTLQPSTCDAKSL